MNKERYLKVGLSLGPVLSGLIIFVLFSFVHASWTSDDEVIGYGMLLPLFIVQLVPLLLIYALTTLVATFILYRQKDKTKSFTFQGFWKGMYELNFVCTTIWVALFAVPLLLFIITFIRFL